MATTTQLAQTNGKVITESSHDSQVRIQECRDSTVNALKLLPTINSIANIVIYCMNIWQRENNFNQFGNSGTSRGNSLVCSKDGVVPSNIQQWKAGLSFYDSFWNSPAIANYRKQAGDQLPAIVDGLYAHGLSQCMGAYNIEGSTANAQMFSSPAYSSIAQSNGLLVPLGTAVTSVYPDNVAGRYKSILAGVIVLDYHYNYWINHSMTNDTIKKIMDSQRTGIIPTNSSINPGQAIILASGSYLGWGTDIYGSTGGDRAFYVNTNRVWRYASSSSTSFSGISAKTSTPLGCV